jgi:signal transduction histidine kinase
LTVTDDGRGVALAALSDNDRQGQGIANMQERASVLGGTLDLKSQPGQGFRLVLSIPCSADKDVEPLVQAEET